MIRVRARRIHKRIRDIAFLVYIIAAVIVISYLITRTVSGTLILTLGFLFGAFIGYLILVASERTAKSLGERTRKASAEELEKEDDVLLQAVAFSQSVLFIYLNLIEGSDVVTAFKIIVPIFAVLFYVLRAWGKITHNAKYRYWSIWLLFFVFMNTILAFTYGLITTAMKFEKTDVRVFFLSFVYAGILVGSMRFIEEVFKKRYGYT